MVSVDIPIRAPDAALTVFKPNSDHLLGSRGVLGKLIAERASLDDQIAALEQAQERVQGVIAEAEAMEREAALALDEEARRIREWATSGAECFLPRPSVIKQ